MSQVNERKVIPSPQRWPYKFVLIMSLAPMVFFILAFVTSWPLGPKFVDEGSITKIRLAVATLAFGQLLLMIYLSLFLAVGFGELKRLIGECGKPAKKQP